MFKALILQHLYNISIEFLVNVEVQYTALASGHVPLLLDADVDNSQTKKEGVSRAYKGFDGYAPRPPVLVEKVAVRAVHRPFSSGHWRRHAGSRPSPSYCAWTAVMMPLKICNRETPSVSFQDKAAGQKPSNTVLSKLVAKLKVYYVISF